MNEGERCERDPRPRGGERLHRCLIGDRDDLTPEPITRLRERERVRERDHDRRGERDRNLEW